MNLKSSRSTTNIVGLFGMAQDATFENIALEDVNIIGNQDAGAIVGKAIGIDMSKCYVTGVIEGNDHVGSLVGGIYSGGTSNINNCYSPATVKTRNYQVGGLLGVASSTNLENCYFAGTVSSTAETLAWMHNAGGFVGLVEDANVFINNCVSAASSVTGGTANPYVARGDAESTVTSCVYRSDMSISAPADDTNVGSAQPDAADARELNELTIESTYSNLTWDFSTIWSIENGQFPTLKNVGNISGIDQLKSDITKYIAYTSNGKLVVKGISNASVSVFNVNGMLVAKTRSASGQTELNLPSRGVYLVSISENAKTTLLKVIF